MNTFMEDNTPLSLDTATPVLEEPISLDTGSTNTMLTPEVAFSRAAKAFYGLNKTLPKTQSEYYQDFAGGKEDEVRKQAAYAMDFNKTMLANKMLSEHANRTGGLTIQDFNNVRNMVNNWDPTNPQSVLEDAFSVNAINRIYMANDGLDNSEDRPYTMVEDAFKLIPNLTKKTLEESSVYSAKIEWWRNQRENLQADLDNQSWLGWGADQAKMLLQPYSEAKLRGNVPIDTYGGLGTSLEEQAKALLRMPKNEMIEKGSKILNQLKKDNPTIAAKFADAVIGQNDIVLDNAFTALALPDLFAGGKIATSLARKVFLYNDVRVAAKTAVKGLENVSKQPVKVAVSDAVGDLPEAAIQKELNALTQTAKSEQQAIKDAMDQLPSVMRADVENITKSPGRFGQELVNRLRESYETFETNLLDTIQRISKVERITPVVATEMGIRALMADLRESYPSLRNSILNISSVYKKDLTNTYHADLIIGNPNGGFFLRREGAEAFARFAGLKINAVEDIGQQGAGYFIKVSKPINETTHVVRDFLTQTAASRSPTSWVNAFAGWLRTPEETLAHEQLLNRKIATYAPSELMKVAKETAKDIEQLARFTLPFTARKERWNEWKRIVQMAQEEKDPISGIKGVFKNSPAELEVAYQQMFQRMPNEAEVRAYFSFKRLGEMDHILRNLQIYKNMSRVGTENHVFTVLGQNGKVISSKTFQGVIRREFPGGEGNTLIVNEKLGTEKILVDGKMNTTAKRQLIQDIKEGKRTVIELYDPELRPFTNFSSQVGDERIRWVVVPTNKLQTDKLNMVNLPYRGGGHFEYDYEHYIKQAKVRPERIGSAFRNWYEGDTTIMPVAVRAMGHDLAAKMNAVRELIAAKRLGEAKELASRTLPMEWKEFYGWFRKTKNPVTGEIQAARLNVREPFQVVERNKMIIDKGKDALEERYHRLEDGTRKGSLARQYSVQYSGERDAYDVLSVENRGTAYNPLYQLTDPAMLDPITTMNRSLSRIVNSFFMDDYKISAIEHWLKEASTHLNLKQSEIHYAPFHVFNNINPNMWKKAAPPEAVKQLENRRYQILQFTGTPSSTEALVHSLAQKWSDMIYNKLGPEGLKVGSFQVSPSYLLSRLTDPVKFVRSVTFHMKLGLFSIPQFLVQSQTYVNILGIAGFSKAAPGTFGALLHQWSRINPNMINSLDRYASRLHIPGTSRWKLGEFKEAWTELQNTGFANVGGEYALRDDLMSHKVFSTGRDKFLDAGTFFFKEGERNVRLGAWYTAYREWRDLNPTKIITDIERREILDRASLLNVNMDRSSNSVLQHGAFSIPAQFLTYQIRAAELFLGKRLSSLERWRMLATNAAVYGIPTAVSGATIYPFGDNIRKTAIDNGYVVGDNYLSTLMEGLPATLMAFATGGGDISKGNWYNIGPRYGSSGFTPLRDALISDRTLWDIMFGAAGSTIGNTWAASDGFRRAMLSFASAEDKQFKMKPDDVVDIFKEISSVNSAWRLWAAINSGRWMDKAERWVSDITPMNAIFQSVTGLQDQQIEDVRTMRMIKKDEKALAEYSMKKFSEEMQRGFRSMKDNDPQQANDFFRRAFTWMRVGGVPEHDYGTAMSRATENNENLIQRGKWDFYTKDVPQSKSRFGIFTRENLPSDRLDTLRRELQKGQ